MKKRFILWLTLCAAALMVLVGFGIKLSEVTIESDGDIVTIEKSGIAKIYEKTLLSWFDDKSYFQEDKFDEVLQDIENREEQQLPSCNLKNTKDCENFEGYNVYTLANEDYENVILYLHGGAWIFEINKAHVKFCDELATRLNAKVYIPLYPLAPESTGEETYAFIEDLYREILKEGKTVYVMGDSAGGELTLGLMYIIKAKGMEMPEKTVLLSPCSDMTFSNESISEIEETDPELAVYGCLKCAELWAGEDNLTSPQYSALYADVTDYPDTLIIQGTNDILFPDNGILYERLKAAGVNVTFVQGNGLWHVFPLYPIPEKETGLKLIEKFCRE